MTINATGAQEREMGARLVKSIDCTLAATQIPGMIRDAAIETDTLWRQRSSRPQQLIQVASP